LNKPVWKKRISQLSGSCTVPSGNDYRIAQLLSQDMRWNQMDGLPGRGICVGISEVLGHVFAGLRCEWTDWQSVANDFFAFGETVFVKGYYSGTIGPAGMLLKYRSLPNTE